MNQILKSTQSQSLLVVGHSHSGAIYNAAIYLKKEAKVNFDCRMIQLFGRYPDFSEEKNGVIVYNSNLVDEIIRNIDDTTSLIAFPLFGSEYYMTCFPNTPRRFDVIVPGHSETSQNVELIPFNILYEMARIEYKKYIGLLPYIRDRAKCDVVYVLPPPPTRDSKTIHEHIAAQSKDIASRHAALTSLQLFNSWLTYAKAARDICGEKGIRLIPPPAHALTHEGYLKPHLVQDSVHGNIHYGAMVLQDLIDQFLVGGAQVAQ